MRFAILGPLRVGGGEATITAGRDRTVLAVLLLRAGRVVPVEELIDAVWEDRPPATARTQLQICVSRLRHRLATLGPPAEIIITDPVGYGVRIEPDDLDAEVFARGVEAGRVAAAALEECVDVELRLRRAADVIDELTENVERHPLRERLRGQLMLALSAVGRQADALAVYREGRRIYAQELGIEPGAALQELHQRVLAGDLALAGADNRTIVPVRSLPRAISDFTGRQETVARLVKEIEGDGVRIQLVDGMPGSGKTTLAVYVATALGERFPDAHLFVDLHGHSERTPLTPAAAMATLLRQLGVPPERVPLDVDDRLALWRTELAGRRAVVVFDNAASTAQVAPLLPNGPDNVVLITSRRRLVGLDDGRPSSLTVLERDEAVELLGRVAGAGRIEAEPVAAAEVARRCGYLPLALRLAGARLAHRPGWRVSDLAERLATGSDPLAELAAGQRSVGQAFALSYAQLPPPAQRLFRLLGLHPGARFDNGVAAALLGVPMPASQHLLDELVDAHLAEEVQPGRYRLHDLIREYSRTISGQPEHATERRLALERLLDHHMHVAAAIARTIELVGSPSLSRLPEPTRLDLVTATAAQGRSWFDENRAALTALVRLAEAEGLLRHCWQLARATWRANFDGGHLDELLETHTIALRAAEALGDDEAIATTLNYLASAHYRLARFTEAIRLMEVALVHRRRLGRAAEIGSTLGNLGVAALTNGDYRRGKEYLDEALALKQHSNGAHASFLNNLAYGLLCWGRYPEGLRVARHHLFLAQQHRDTRHVALAMGHIGMIRHRLGHTEPARRLLRVALRFKRQAANRFGEAELLNELGMIEQETGRPERAAEMHREALLIMIEAADRIGQCSSRNLLARAILQQGDVASALDLHRRVLEDATRLGSRHEQARALDGMARCVRGSDPGRARTYASRALALFRQIESPDQHPTAALLAELG
ncbi:BTAD domain-containing putative transcriptional regulator [Micromonospora sp. CA-244673]|uniref:AfsR/SARP family transcriptional regulator n=1 Tax=Micromonospora sp. CA-244673 TaxID=3239958 RepID=UPI003D8CFB20